jgi:hypothetical protein
VLWLSITTPHIFPPARAKVPSYRKPSAQCNQAARDVGVPYTTFGEPALANL